MTANLWPYAKRIASDAVNHTPSFQGPARRTPTETKEIDSIIRELKTKTKPDITVEGNLADFLGRSIDRREDGSIHLLQPHLIHQILADLCMEGNDVKTRSTPMVSFKLLCWRHTESSSLDNSFNY